MAIVGLGTDIVEIARIEGALRRNGARFAQRILSEAEWPHYQASALPARFLAKRFAAKEATAKALGTGFRHGLAFAHIEIMHDTLGKPVLKLTQQALRQAQQLGVTHLHLSLSDEHHYACATVILEHCPPAPVLTEEAGCNNESASETASF